MQPAAIPFSKPPDPRQPAEIAGPRPARPRKRAVAISVVAVVVGVVVILGVYAATRTPASEPTSLPIPAGTVLAFNPRVPGIQVVNVTGGPLKFTRLFAFTVSQPNASVVGAWSFDPTSAQVYAGLVRTNVGSWGGLLGDLSGSPYRANVTAGSWELGIVAWGPGNLTVTQTIRCY